MEQYLFVLVQTGLSFMLTHELVKRFWTKKRPLRFYDKDRDFTKNDQDKSNFYVNINTCLEAFLRLILRTCE